MTSGSWSGRTVGQAAGLSATAWFCLLLALLPGWHPSAVAAIELVDDSGRRVQLASPARRVVSLAPHITESLFAIGAGDRVVGTMAWSDYPAAARKIVEVGSHQSINYERILALQPELVITWMSGIGEDVTRRLLSLGLKVYVTEPRALPDIARALEHLGQLTGREQSADPVIAGFLLNLGRLRAEFANATPVRVFYQVWDQPLITLNGRHLVSDVIRLCGGRNVFADAVPLVPQVSIEAVVAAAPEVIVASAPGGRRPPWLEDWRQWPGIAAVETGHLYAIDADLLNRHTPRIIGGARQLCGILEDVRSGRKSSTDR